ncbi:unnamed protein product [Cuscuta campestris]|uniref:Uncharacterized protein n=1 Tax=Cuscuta campestris TaxID=132261 RepID=A0A484N7S6_9ASTE|nr:unnamed protein product [Cuscuta campestris]
MTSCQVPYFLMFYRSGADHRFDFNCEISLVNEGDAGIGMLTMLDFESKTLNVTLEVYLLKAHRNLVKFYAQRTGELQPKHRPSFCQQ